MKQTKHTKSAVLMLIALLLVACALLCLAACDDPNNSPNTPNNGNDSDGNVTPSDENNNNSDEVDEILNLISKATCYAAENNIPYFHFYVRSINSAYIEDKEIDIPTGYLCELSLFWEIDSHSDGVALLYFKNEEAAKNATLPSKYDYCDYIQRDKTVVTVSETDTFMTTLNAIKDFTPSENFIYKNEEKFIRDNLNSQLHSNNYLGTIVDCDICNEFDLFRSDTTLTGISCQIENYPKVGNCLEYYYCMSSEPAETYPQNIPEMINDEFTQDSYVKQDDNGTVYAQLKEKSGLKFTLIDGKDEYRIYKFNYDTADDFNLIIPSEYNGKPVTAIDNGNDNNTTDASFDGGIFDYCTNLISVVIPDSITYIDYLAFRGCSGLKSVTIPDSVTEIDRCAFWHCDELTSVTIGVGLKTIGSQAFDYCPKLTNVYIKDIAKWCELSFGNQNDSSYNLYLNDELITDLIIPDTLTEISSGAFYNCGSLTSVAIPDGVQRIGYNAFTNCDNLTNIVIPDSVQGIEQSAFADCDNLTEVTIGSNVTYIGSSAFSRCKNLTSITVSANNTKFHSAGNCIIETETNTLIFGLANCIIPTDGSVQVIGEYAFSYCTELTSIVIPASVLFIQKNAFCNCSNLSSISIQNHENMLLIMENAFDGCTNLGIIRFDGTIREWNNTIRTFGDIGISNYTVICTDGTI